MKKYFVIVVSGLFLFFGCSSFSDKHLNFRKININNVDVLTGNYSIFAIKAPKEAYPYFDNANEKFYRKYGRGKSDTIKFDSIHGGNFKILIKNAKEINLQFEQNNKILKSQTLEYIIKDDGYLYIKNRNTIVKGIPYIFGGVDIRKVRIALSENGDLIINDIFASSGALLLIFGDAKVWESTNNYKRIK